MVRALFLLIGFLCPVLASAQTGSITGTIRHAFLGDPLPGVNLALEQTRWGAATSSDGSYRITAIPVGRYVLVVTSMGFEAQELVVEIVAGDTLVLDIDLKEHPIEISEIVVERVMLTGGQGGVLDIPGAAHYIDANELETFSYNDIHRILRRVPGINIQEEDGYGLRPNIGMRGTGVERSSKITVMEDGVLMAPAPYAAPAAYYFPTPGRMQGVEVRKGSSQIKYGPQTTGGALNLISTQIPDRFSGHAKILAGSHDERTIHANIGESYKNVGFLVETYQTKTRGFKELEFGDDTGFDKKDYLAKLRINTSPSASVYQALTLKASQTLETSNETYLGLTDADFNISPFMRYAGSQEDVMNTEQRQYIARYVLRPSNFVDITTTLYRTEFSRNWFKLDKVRTSIDGPGVGIASILENPELFAEEYAILRGSTSSNDNALTVKNNNRDYYAQGVQSIIGLTIPTKTALHEVEMGIRYHEDEIDRFQWVDSYRMNNPAGDLSGKMLLTQPGLPGTESNRITQARALASHVQYRLSFGKWTTTPGLRYEHIMLERKDYGREDPERTGSDLSARENSVDVFIPGIGVDYAWTAHLHSFAGLHKGFAPPGTRMGSEPEESVNYEAGLRYKTQQLFVESVLFFSDYSNLLGSDLAAAGGGGTLDQFNGGEVDAFGLEMALETQFSIGSNRDILLPIHANYTFSRAQFQNAFESEYEPWGTVGKGDELPYLPRHQMTIEIGLEKGRVAMDASVNYVSKMRTTAGQGAFLPKQVTDAHFVVDVSSSYSITPHVRLFTTVRNLTDQTYIVARRPAGVRPGLPRLLVFGIRASF